jgi:hypothetical protein
MSILHVGHIQAAIEKRFRDLIDVSDVKQADREDFFLTRGLSAFVISELSGAEDNIAAASVLDCPQDNGIDALHFDATERVCYLVQSKWIKSGNGSVDLGAAHKFKQGVHDFFQGNLGPFGPKMKKLRPLVDEVLADSRNTFVLVLAYTGQQPLSTEVQRPLDELVKALNDTTELVSLRIVKQGDLHGIVAQRALGETVNINIMLKEWGIVREPYTAYYGQVDLRDIAAWGKFGQYLYAKNIRGFKGNTDVNEGIINTIRTNPQHFWYFNNGITVVSSKVTPQALGSGTQDSRVFECEGASVVNGAQTVGSIISAVAGGANGLQNARVLVRIISLENCPATFGVDLTKAANTQNRIESKDFVTQDPQQARLQADLFLETSKRYVYRSGDVLPIPDEGLSFEEAAVALACAHPDITHSVQAKREVGKLWEDIARTPYTILFNASTSALRMWKAVEIMRLVELELRAFQSTHEGKPRLIATHGNRFVLHMVFRLGLDPDSIDLQKAREVIPDIVKSILEKLIWTVMKLYESSYPSNLFKNLRRQTSVGNHRKYDSNLDFSSLLQPECAARFLPFSPTGDHFCLARRV